MSKFIRIKDGKIGKVTHEDNKNYRAKFGRKCPLVSKEEVIKQSDSIEELCDYVFLYDSHNELVITDLKKTSLYILKHSLKDGLVRNIKLAILTDKGLIYVAKMNEKGELELL